MENHPTYTKLPRVVVEKLTELARTQARWSPEMDRYLILYLARLDHAWDAESWEIYKTETDVALVEDILFFISTL